MSRADLALSKSSELLAVKHDFKPGYIHESSTNHNQEESDQKLEVSPSTHRENLESANTYDRRLALLQKQSVEIQRLPEFYKERVD